MPDSQRPTLEIERHGCPLVIGSGVAGLSVALGLGQAVIVSSASLGAGGASRWAQGGVAAALGSGDSPRSHKDDTIRVGADLVDPIVAGLVTDGAAEAIAVLQSLGARFDRSGDEPSLDLGREAGHTHHRIVHAEGDSTGAELMRALEAAAVAEPSLRVIDHAEAVDLVLDESDRVIGVVVHHSLDDRWVLHLAPAVVLATGGYGHAFARTSTPPEVKGSGIAMAARAGAALADMEFVQFHPTALDVDTDPLPLLTEALRGEGARLVDKDHRRIMLGQHPDAELAPRDVVARVVYRCQLDGGRPALDARSIGHSFPVRFPTVFAAASDFGMDPRKQPLPVSAAAHYTMGGIESDHRGRTSLAGLWAVGEVTSTGFHGANRLASNSLLEGLVVGRRAAADIKDGQWLAPTMVDGRVPTRVFDWMAGRYDLGAELEASQTIRHLLWESAGVERSRVGLESGLRRLGQLEAEARLVYTGADAVTVARLVLEAALSRTESRGAHHRVDYPESDSGQAERRRQWPKASSTVPVDLTEPIAVSSAVPGEASSPR